MPYKEKRVVVVMPAYNAEKTLVECYDAIPKDWVDEVIVVDDASTDDTVKVARTLPVFVKTHPENRGYGGNQKTCYRLAAERGADIIIMVHPDHQYDPKFIPEIVRSMVDGNRPAVFGSRMIIRDDALSGGMPMWKFVCNIGLTKVGNMALRTDLTEFHSGFRAFDARVLDSIDIERNSDDFVFDTQIIIQLISKGFPIVEIPITTRYFDTASQIGFFPSVKYGVGILVNLFLYRTGLRRF